MLQENRSVCLNCRLLSAPCLLQICGYCESTSTCLLGSRAGPTVASTCSYPSVWLFGTVLVFISTKECFKKSRVIAEQQA